jgi:hypothetical protein
MGFNMLIDGLSFVLGFIVGMGFLYFAVLAKEQSHVQDFLKKLRGVKIEK